MKYNHLAMLFGALMLMQAQLPAQTEAPPSVTVPARVIPRESPPNPPEPPPKTTYEVRKFATSDLSKIRLNVVSGHIVFTAADIDYVYYPSSNEHTTSAGDVTACLAVLAELRRSEAFEVQVPVRLPDMPSDRKRITVSELTIPIDKLK